MKRRDVEKAQGLLREYEAIEGACKILSDPGATKEGFLRHTADGKYKYIVSLSPYILNGEEALLSAIKQLYENEANKLRMKLIALGVEL